MHECNEQDEETCEENHALVPSSSTTLSKEMVPLQTRSMDPSKDLAAYGYGSVAWKERMETWKQRQIKLGNVRKENDNKEDSNNLVDDDDTEFLM